MSPREWRLRVEDIMAAVRKAAGYVQGMSAEQFAADSRTLDAVVRNLIVIGEAARRVPEAVCNRHASVPWRLMGDMRNFAVHEYWGVSAETIWRTVSEKLPPLVPLLEQVLEAEKE